MPSYFLFDPNYPKPQPQLSFIDFQNSDSRHTLPTYNRPDFLDTFTPKDEPRCPMTANPRTMVQGLRAAEVAGRPAPTREEVSG